MPPPIFVINLDRRADRAEHMRRSLDAAGLPFELLAAVDGRAASPDQVAAWEALPRGGKPLDAWPAGTRPGLFGCFESHRNAWRAIVASEHAHGIVFEDDVLIGRNAGQLLRNLDWVPADADLVKLETWLARTRIGRARSERVRGRRLHPLRMRHLGAGGYVISSAAAEQLLAATERLFAPTDELLFDPDRPAIGALTRYQLVPAVVVQAVQLGDTALDDIRESDIDQRRSTAKPRLAGRGRRDLTLRLRSLRWRVWNRVASIARKDWTTRIEFE